MKWLPPTINCVTNFTGSIMGTFRIGAKNGHI